MAAPPALPAGPRPAFHNVEPRTREERMAMNDKDALEKLRLEHRKGGNYKHVGSDNVIQPAAASAAYMSEADRFGTDAAAEEFERRQLKKLQRDEWLERKRAHNYFREEARWQRVHNEQKAEDIKLQELKDGPVPTRNKSSVKYNMITLAYEDSYDGAHLKYQDDAIKYQTAVDANQLRHVKSSVDYDMITGEPLVNKVPIPPKPVEPEKPAERERETMEAFRVDALYGKNKETHDGTGRQEGY
jgi:hypothetical protein